MVEIKSQEFVPNSRLAVEDSKLQRQLEQITARYLRRRQALMEYQEWQEVRDRAREAKERALERLDYYLDMLANQVEKAGGVVHWASDAAEARDVILSLALANEVKLVAKGKSMTSEEIGINKALAERGIEAVETDLGEFIVQLAEERPFHIVGPAQHKTLQDVAELFARKLGVPLYETREELTKVARELLRGKFLQADMGLTGANFAVAETGTIVILENEGNARLTTSLPRIHVALVGIEKVVASLQDLAVLLKALTRAATGQKITGYVSLITGPRKAGEDAGPREFHLVLLDNGRSNILRDAEMREALLCVRCGACMYACPVYRKVGGHAYGSVYPGPIGAVITPLMAGLSQAKELPFASSLCGACRESCPVKIDIPHMLVRLRRRIVNEPSAKASRPLLGRSVLGVWRWAVSSPKTYAWASWAVRLLQRPFIRKGTLRRLPPPFGGWTQGREFPAFAKASFRQRWTRGLKRDEHDHS